MAPHGPLSDALGDDVLLRDRAELLAARVEHLPVDADALLAAAGIGQLDAALYHIDVDGRAVGKLNAAGIEALLQGGRQRSLAVAGRARHGCHDHAGGLGARSAGGGGGCRGRRGRGCLPKQPPPSGAGRHARRHAGGELRGGLAGDAADRRAIDAAPRIGAGRGRRSTSSPETRATRVPFASSTSQI